MSIVEALRIALPKGLSIRRPIAKHWGSNRSGWLASHWVMDLMANTETGSIFGRDHMWRTLINERDILADDWEVKENA